MVEASSYHEFLSNYGFLEGYFHTKVTSSHHQSVTFPYHVIQVVNSLMILYFWDDSDMLSLLPHEFAKSCYVTAVTSKRQCNHVHVVLQTKIDNIVLVLGCHCWHVKNLAWQAHIFFLA